MRGVSTYGSNLVSASRPHANSRKNGDMSDEDDHSEDGQLRSPHYTTNTNDRDRYASQHFQANPFCHTAVLYLLVNPKQQQQRQQQQIHEPIPFHHYCCCLVHQLCFSSLLCLLFPLSSAFQFKFVDFPLKRPKKKKQNKTKQNKTKKVYEKENNANSHGNQLHF